MAVVVERLPDVFPLGHVPEGQGLIVAPRRQHSGVGRELAYPKGGLGLMFEFA